MLWWARHIALRFLSPSRFTHPLHSIVLYNILIKLIYLFIFIYFFIFQFFFNFFNVVYSYLYVATQNKHLFWQLSIVLNLLRSVLQPGKFQVSLICNVVVFYSFFTWLQAVFLYSHYVKIAYTWLNEGAWAYFQGHPDVHVLWRPPRGLCLEGELIRRRNSRLQVCNVHVLCYQNWVL